MREFLYVDDLSRAIIYILKENINEELINIGSGEEISIYNLSLLIKEVVGFKGSLEFGSKMPDGNQESF